MKFRYRHGDRPLEGYTILRGVGRGGFGEVYYAVSDGGREVALKSLIQNEDIEVRGVRHCINLKSPNLLSIFDIRKDDQGSLWVIMEYVTGPSLREIIEARPGGIGEQEAGYIAREMGRGLGYLHREGIVHRDLKPENIFFEDGFVKIGDYGLSKFINASQRSGQTISVGTVHYMAPEIGSGKYHRGIDIYALGVILFELLTGEVPFQGDSFGEILMKHLTVEPDVSRIREPFRGAIRGALEKDPARRFQSVDEMMRGALADTALEVSISSFNPASLSGVARREAVAPGRGPGIPGPRLAAAGPAPVEGAAPPQQESPAKPPPLPARARHDEPYLEVVEPAEGRQGEVAGESPAYQAGRLVGRGMRRMGFLVSPAARDFPPGPAGRFFCVFLGSAMLAAGVSCLVAPGVVSLHGNEFVACLGFAIGLLGYATFCFYRGLRARRAAFWERSLSPFLKTTFLNATVISGMILVVGPFHGMDDDDERLAVLVVLVISFGLLSLTIFLNRIIARWRAIADSIPPGVPRHRRSVPLGFRVVNLFLGCGAVVTATGMALAAVLHGHHSPWDRFAFLCAAVAFASLGGYLLRQSMRRLRGDLWNGTVRPFLKYAVVATLVICVLPLLCGLHMREVEVMIFTVLGIVAVALGIALRVLARADRAALP